MKEHPAANDNKTVDDLLNNLWKTAEIYRILFPVPVARLSKLLGLHFFIGYSPIGGISNEYPPKEIHDKMDIIQIDEYLGKYDAEQRRITLYKKNLEKVSEILQCSFEHLKYIVDFHENVHAIMHAGVEKERYDDHYIKSSKWSDDESEKNIKSILSEKDIFYRDLDSTFHERIAQIMTYKTLEYNYSVARKEDYKIIIQSMIDTFSKLENYQPSSYRVTNLYEVPVERIIKAIEFLRDGSIKRDFTLFDTILTW